MNDEKTMVYWIGLILLSAASVALFGILWMIAFTVHTSLRADVISRGPLVPAVVGGVVFIIIGIHMIQEGVT